MSNQQKAGPAPAAPVPQETENRSEGLLPADGPDANLEVAEEISFDLQSDSTRQVGGMPPDTPVSKPAEALAETLKPGGLSGTSEADQTSGTAQP
jgi:hypothetical protein